jgi:hypothetical protein
MIEWCIIGGIAAWFAKETKSMGKSGFLWGFIACVGFYIPALISKYLIYPSLVKEHLTQYNLAEYGLYNQILFYVVGLISLATIYFIFNKVTKEYTLKTQRKLDQQRETRIPLSTLSDLNSAIEKKSYTKRTGIFISTIIHIDASENKCIVKGGFNKETERSIATVMIDEE